tara:strand:+ start:953 stop:1276 length:324 start_codon:yes stop_codon:yes gene_type:complete
MKLIEWYERKYNQWHSGILVKQGSKHLHVLQLRNYKIRKMQRDDVRDAIFIKSKVKNQSGKYKYDIDLALRFYKYGRKDERGNRWGGHWKKFKANASQEVKDIFNTA